MKKIEVKKFIDKTPVFYINDSTVPIKSSEVYFCRQGFILLNDSHHFYTFEKINQLATEILI